MHSSFSSFSPFAGRSHDRSVLLTGELALRCWVYDPKLFLTPSCLFFLEDVRAIIGAFHTFDLNRYCVAFIAWVANDKGSAFQKH